MDTTNLKMPSIEDLEMSLRSKRQLANLLSVNVVPSPRGQQLADGYVRLVEKALLEYTSARDRFIKYMRDGSVDDNFRAQDHFESCVNSLHRAIVYLDRLRQMGFRMADGSQFIPKPRDLGVLREYVKTAVRSFRGMCEHFDEDILDGRVPEDTDIAIHLGWQSARIVTVELRYDDITKWIRQLHKFAVLLSRVQIIITNPDSMTLNGKPQVLELE